MAILVEGVLLLALIAVIVRLNHFSRYMQWREQERFEAEVRVAVARMEREPWACEQELGL